MAWSVTTFFKASFTIPSVNILPLAWEAKSSLCLLARCLNLLVGTAVPVVLMSWNMVCQNSVESCSTFNFREFLASIEGMARIC